VKGYARIHRDVFPLVATIVPPSERNVVEGQVFIEHIVAFNNSGLGSAVEISLLG
jgi:hypothetical protein